MYASYTFQEKCSISPDAKVRPHIWRVPTRLRHMSWNICNFNSQFSLPISYMSGRTMRTSFVSSKTSCYTHTRLSAYLKSFRHISLINEQCTSCPAGEMNESQSEEGTRKWLLARITTDWNIGLRHLSYKYKVFGTSTAGIKQVLCC